MSIYVYTTEQCRKDAKKQGRLDYVERLVREVEMDQTTASFFPYPQNYLKKRRGNLRLVGKRILVGEDTVVAMMGMLVRG